MIENAHVEDLISSLEELFKVCRVVSLSSRFNDASYSMEYRLIALEESGQGSDCFVYEFHDENRGLVCVSRERYP